jgi:hypothetical protein
MRLHFSSFKVDRHPRKSTPPPPHTVRGLPSHIGAAQALRILRREEDKQGSERVLLLHPQSSALFSILSSSTPPAAPYFVGCQSEVHWVMLVSANLPRISFPSGSKRRTLFDERGSAHLHQLRIRTVGLEAAFRVCSSQKQTPC